MNEWMSKCTKQTTGKTETAAVACSSSWNEWGCFSLLPAWTHKAKLSAEEELDVLVEIILTAASTSVDSLEEKIMSHHDEVFYFESWIHKNKLGCCVKHNKTEWDNLVIVFGHSKNKSKTGNEDFCHVFFYLIHLIDLCKHMFILNLMPTTCFNLDRGGKRLEKSTAQKTPVSNIGQVNRFTGNSTQNHDSAWKGFSWQPQLFTSKNRMKCITWSYKE